MPQSPALAGCGVGALTGALRAAGVRGMGGPIDEAEVFASLGGIGFHYRVGGHTPTARVLLDGTAAGLDTRTEHVVRTVQRLGARAELRAWADEGALAAWLAANASAATPVVTWLDRGSVPYDPLPRGYQRAFAHPVLVVGADADEVRLVDRSLAIVSVDWLRLRVSWSQCTIEPPTTLRVLGGAVRGEAGPALVAEALADGLRRLLDTPIGGSGVAGIRTLASRIRAPGRPSGWRWVFPRGAALLNAHAALYRFVEEGAGVGLGRARFADALQTLGESTGRPALVAHATRWRERAAAWSAVAVEALPEDIPALYEVRLLLAARARAWRAEGLGASALLGEISRRLAEITRQSEVDFPVDPPTLAFRHAALATSVAKLADAEAELGQGTLSELVRAPLAQF